MAGYNITTQYGVDNYYQQTAAAATNYNPRGSVVAVRGVRGGRGVNQTLVGSTTGWEGYNTQQDDTSMYYDDSYSQQTAMPTYPIPPVYQGQGRGVTRGRVGGNTIPGRGPSAMISRGSSHNKSTNSQQSFGAVRPVDEDACKMFIGGLDWALTADQIHEYFENFGPVVEVKLKTDIYTGQSRGFAFLLFQNPESVDKVLEQKVHMLFGKRIDPKRAVTTESGGGVNSRKLFVGGLDPTMTEQEIMDAFSVYGKVLLVELPVDRSNNQRRSFGFVLFESENSVNQLCQKTKIQLGTKMVDIRKLQSKEDLGPKFTFNQGKRRGTGGMYNTSNMYNQMYDYYDPNNTGMLEAGGVGAVGNNYGYAGAGGYEVQPSFANTRGFRTGMNIRGARAYHPYSR